MSTRAGEDKPLLEIVTSHHGLSLLNGIRMAEVSKHIYTTAISKHTLALETFHFVYHRLQLDPRTGNTTTSVCMCPPGRLGRWLDGDVFQPDYYEFCKERTSSAAERKLIEDVVRAYKICDKAAKNVNLRERKVEIEQAKSICPNHCPLSYLLLFAMKSEAQSNKYSGIKSYGTVEQLLRGAVSAGRELVSLLKANEFAEGNLYVFVPTRNYCRALYVLGSYLLLSGKLKEAFRLLQEYLANDIHDCLGARHKQLLVVLEGRARFLDERLPDLLKAKFDEDQVTDKVFALWNYSRALFQFTKDGKCVKSNRLLKYAITMNCYVPPLLLDWEGSKSCTGSLVSIGHQTEAYDYAADNGKFWDECKGALEWLEDVYINHEKAVVPKINKRGKTLLSQGNVLLSTGLNTGQLSKMPEAAEKFEKLLNIAEADGGVGGAVRLDALEKIGVCYKHMGKPRIALTYIERALQCQSILCQEKDQHKELLYQSATCKEGLGDYEGALQDYKHVLDRIGYFTTAVEGIKRIERKINRSSNIIPTYDGNWPPVSQEVIDEQDRERERLRFALGVHDPNDTIAAKQERCFHCKRGGIKLSHCANCQSDGVVYCSKDCQKQSWKRIHKYLCPGSKFWMEEGCQVIIEGLEKSPQYNGKMGKIGRYSGAKERFVVELLERDLSILVKPQNLKLVH